MIYLVDRMKNNTITWCMEGSYHRNCVPRVSGTGWMVLYALCHPISALYMFYKIETWHIAVNCNNQDTVNMSEINLQII